MAGASRFVAAAWLAAFAMWGTLLAIVPVLTQVGTELSLRSSDLGLALSFPILCLAVLAPVGGSLADTVGPRKIGAAGLLLVGIGGILRGFSTDLTNLLLYAAVLGIGWGLTLPSLPKLIGGWFAVAGTATGAYVTGSYVGAGLATAIVLSASWRLSLIYWGAGAVVIALVWLAIVKDPPAVKAGPRNFAAVAKNRGVLALTGIFFFGANVTFYTLTGWLPEILSKSSPHASATFVASLLSFTAVPATLAVPFLSDRLRKRRPFLLASSLLGAVGAYFLFSPSPLIQAASVVVLGVTVGAIFVICLTLLTEVVDASLVGSASGFVLLAYLGGVLGPWLSGVTQDTYGGFFPTMAMLIAALLASALLTLALPETGGKAIRV